MREIARKDAAARAALTGLAERACALADAMDFRFLYDPQRRIFSIGYRLADAEGPARLDYWVRLGREQASRLGVEAVPLVDSGFVPPHATPSSRQPPHPRGARSPPPRRRPRHSPRRN